MVGHSRIFLKKKMFILGDIPLVGDALFSSKSKAENVTEMIIFIRPFLLNSDTDAQENSDAYRKTLVSETQEEVDSYMDTGNFSKKDIFQTKKRRHVTRPTVHGKRLKANIDKAASKSKNHHMKHNKAKHAKSHKNKNK